jgi:hypothetical protein
MTSKSPYLLFSLACNLIICAFATGQKSDSLSRNYINRQPQKVLKLKHNFEIIVGQSEDFGDLVTYTHFVLTHNGRQIYSDTTSSTEYEFGSKLYPIIRIIDKATFEILVEINDRPSRNYLKYFKVSNNKIVENKKIPTFISKAKNLDNDKRLEYAGFWDWSESWGEDGELTAYNPILYYELTSEGIILDRQLTIKKNKEIYGHFHGFQYSEKVVIRTSECKKWDTEIDRINVGRK